MARYQRSHAADGQAVSPLELFYDLVFVFAITQISHGLLEDLTWGGAGRAAVVLLVVWWAWNYTAWVTNELDPDASVVRAVLMAVTLGSLLLTVAIPQAFGARAGLFAGAYVAIQVGRHAFLAFGSAAAGTIERERAGRVLTWFCAAGALWIAGAVAAGPLRTALWLGGLALDYGGPVALFWIPGRPGIAASAWEVAASHFVERFSLFVIVALGESIVVTGATTSQLALSAGRIVAFVLAFAGTAALWWLYFSGAGGLEEERLEASASRTTLARDAYTYLHVAIVAGVILTAVGDELVIAHPGEQLRTAAVVATVAGPALYLLAHGAFRQRVTGRVDPQRVLGAAACVAAAAVGAIAPATVLAAVLGAIVVAVVAADYRRAAAA